MTKITRLTKTTMATAVVKNEFVRCVGLDSIRNKTTHLISLFEYPTKLQSFRPLNQLN